MRTVAVVLIAVGLIGILWGGINYTTKEKVIDLGPIQASADKEHHIPLPPIAGAFGAIASCVYAKPLEQPLVPDAFVAWAYIVVVVFALTGTFGMDHVPLAPEPVPIGCWPEAAQLFAL